MKVKKRIIAALFAPLLAVGSGAAAAHAAGYALFTQGASALGQGNAVTAHNDNASTIFYNPALLTKLDGTQLDFGSTAVFSSHDFQSSTGSSTSSNNSIFFPSTIYLSHKFNDSISAGLGVFNPFGLGTEWNDSWEGRFIATKSELTTFNINPVVAYRVLPPLSVAAGIDIIVLDAKLERRVPAGAFGPAGPATETNVRFKGNGTGIGFNVALAYDVTKDVTMGVSYRSETQVHIDGHSTTSPTFAIPFTPITPLDAKGKTSVRLPQQLTAGLSYHVTPPLIVEAGIRWEGWSSFKSLNIALDNGASFDTPRNWHDTWGMNVGGKYRLNDTASLLAGYIFGSDAVPSYTFDPSIPDSNTHIFCIGTDLNFDKLRVALSYAYQMYVDRTKNNDVGAPFTANGNYESDAHLVALEVGYKF